jgi:hypothetical protein
MKRVKGLVFSSILFEYTTNVNSIGDVVDLLRQNSYNETTGFGFSSIILDNNHLVATLLKRNNTFIQEYDVNSSQLVRRQISVFNTVKFEIDEELNLLTVFGASSQLNALKAIFRNIRELKFVSDPIIIDSDELCQRLKDEGLEPKVKQLTIRSFNYNNGVLGRFSGEVSSQNVAEELMKEYTNNIVKLTFQITINKENILVQLHPNGSVKILCDEDDFEYYLNYLKQIIF